jgi:RNA polymerase sigma factor (sigma-70 family)
MQPLALTEISAKADPALAEPQFAAIVEQHQRPLVQLAFRLVGNVEDAKDLAQLAFAKLWRNRHRLDAEREVFHYLRKTLVHLSIDHLRRRSKHEPEVAFDEAPVLPARLFDDFYGGVREKIATNAQARSRALGLLALLHALRCRRRLAFAVAALIAVITVPLLLVNRFFTPPHSRSVLIQLLEERNWPALYSAMLDRERGSSLLNEPVPVELLRAALAELAQAKSQDRLVRAGLVRVLANFKTPEDTPLGLGRSAQILGKATIKGFELTNRKNRIAWNPEASLQVLLRSSANQTMTIQELLLKTTAKGNRL